MSLRLQLRSTCELRVIMKRWAALRAKGVSKNPAKHTHTLIWVSSLK